MNYQKIYDDLMQSRLQLKQDRYLLKKNKNAYFEGHHIIPKYMGGKGISSKGLNNDNIVYLTAREHFLAHWLFWRIKRDRQSSLAFHKMISCNKNQNRIKSSYAYQEARESFVKTNINNKYGLGVKKIVTQSMKEHQSKVMKGKFKGNKNPFFNKKHSLDTRLKMSELAKNRKGILSATNKGLRLVYKNNVLIGEFLTNEDIAKFTGCSIYGIKNVLGGSQKTTKSYKIIYNSLIS